MRSPEFDVAALEAPCMKFNNTDRTLRRWTHEHFEEVWGELDGKFFSI